MRIRNATLLFPFMFSVARYRQSLGFLPCNSRNHKHHLRAKSLASFHSSTACRLNRILFTPAEVDWTLFDVPAVTLLRHDYRTIHVSKILKVENGTEIRAGVVNDGRDDGRFFAGMKTDKAKIEWLSENPMKESAHLGNGNPPGSLRIYLHSLQAQSLNSTSSSVSLILALPRPIQLARMLPMISQMGVDHLILTEASKVPKDYFGSHLFRDSFFRIQDKLMEGLCQSGDVQLPKLRLVQNLKHFLDRDLDELFPRESYARVIAHPQRNHNDSIRLLKFRHVSFPSDITDEDGKDDEDHNDDTSHFCRRIVVAVGPEGGWEEPTELDRFISCGFQLVTLGERTLRSDCAAISLLCLAHQVCDEKCERKKL